MCDPVSLSDMVYVCVHQYRYMQVILEYTVDGREVYRLIDHARMILNSG